MLVELQVPNIIPCWASSERKYQNGHVLIKVEGERVGAHRHAWEQHNGRKLKSGEIVRHLCDNPPCVNPYHLLVGTHQDNMDDMVRRGRSKKGETSPVSKLTNEQVLDIRRRHALGARQTSLAYLFKVHTETIHSIVHRKTWKHI